MDRYQILEDLRTAMREWYDHHDADPTATEILNLIDELEEEYE